MKDLSGPLYRALHRHVHVSKDGQQLVKEGISCLSPFRRLRRETRDDSQDRHSKGLKRRDGQETALLSFHSLSILGNSFPFYPGCGILANHPFVHCLS